MQHSILPAKWALIHTSVSSLLNAAIAGHSVPVRQVAAILGRLEARGWNRLQQPVKVPKWRKLWIAFRYGVL